MTKTVSAARHGVLPMTGVTDRQRPVFLEMIDGYETERVSTFSNLAISLQMDARDVRNICRALKRKGLAEHVSAFSYRDDGFLSGSGYQLTSKGYSLAKKMRDA